MNEAEFKELARDIADTQRYISNAQERLHELITKLQVATVNDIRRHRETNPD